MVERTRKEVKIPSLAALLYKHLSGQQEKRFTAETDGFLHVTDLFSACMRQIFLTQKHKVSIFEHIPPAKRLLFDAGKAFEEVIKQYMRDMGIFAESHPKLYDHDLRIVATPDGRLLNRMLVEIKGKDPALWVLSARRPTRQHQFQCEEYIRLDKAKIGLIFEATWGKKKVPFRSHVVHFNLKAANVVKKTVGALREAEAGGPLPGRVCLSQDEKRAMQCPVRDLCFAEANNKPMRTIEQELANE